MLSDVTGRYKFEQFCKKQYSSENIKFWQACNDLKLLPLFSIPGSVRLVYEWVNKMGKFCLKIIIIIITVIVYGKMEKPDFALKGLDSTCYWLHI